MIEVSNLCKKFNDDALAVNDISFTVEQGTLLILIGTSGCGKTTTLKMLNRLIEPTSGSILLRGQDIRKEEPVKLRRNIGYVIQNVGLFPHYTVAQNIAVVPNLIRWDGEKIKKRSQELMELMGLPDDFLRRYPQELSGGQRQRVGLARALAADPPLVLLDEPFGALDPITRHQMQEEFKNLQTRLHKTMVLVTHEMFEACELGEKICLMDRGKIQQMGPPKELLFAPANSFVEDFFAANRFQLELKVLTLKDVLDEIPHREISADTFKEFPNETSLLDVLETVEETSLKSSAIDIRDSDGNSVLKTTCDDVLAAFYKTKSRLAGDN